MKQDIKKWSALIVALMMVFGVMVTGAMADTSTVSGALYFDKVALAGGDKTNFSVLGLDKDGGVDLYGEQFGATIEAVVTSQLGTVKLDSPASSGGSPSTGSYAASVQYCRLVQGVGKGYVFYGTTASGTDTITVTLQEAFLNQQGGVTYNVIDTFTQNVTVAKKAVAAKEFRIVVAGNAAIIPTPYENATAIISPETGVQGTVEAGKAANQVVIWAVDGTNLDPTANGTVKLTFYPTSPSQRDSLTGMNYAKNAFTFDVTMTGGRAYFTTTSTSLKEAGKYYIKAENEGFSATLSSVQWEKEDSLIVNPKTDNTKLALTSEKTVISSDGTAGAGTLLKVYMLDPLGNKTLINSSNAAKNLKLTDSESVFSETTSLFAGATANKYWTPPTTVFGEGDYKPGKLGNAKISVAINDKETTVTPSDEVDLKVVSKRLTASTLPPAAPIKAGTAFDAFNVNVAGAPISTSYATTLNVFHYVNGSLKQTTTSTLAKTTTTARIQLQKASGKDVASEYFILGDEGKEYGQTKVDAPQNQWIIPNDASKGYVVNGNSETTTDWALTKNTSGPYDGKYTGDMNPGRINLDDAYGNSVTTANGSVSGAAGSVSISSSKTEQILNASLVPGSNTDPAKLVYPSTFAGTDTPKLTFTAPGVAAVTMNTSVPAASTLTTLVINSVAAEGNALAAETISLPLNGVIPVTLEAKDQNEKRMNDKTVVITVTGTVAPRITDCTNVTNVVSGQLISFDGAFTGTDGRHVLTVAAPNKTGNFTITLTNAAGTVTASKDYVVTQNVEPPVAEVGKDAGITEVEESMTATLNLYVNTTNPDGEAAVYEWFVFTATLAGDAAQLPLYLLPTDGPIVAIEEGIDIYDYTLDYADTDVAFIAALTMADLGLSTGDVFAYAYAYQNEGGDIYLPNVVFITVK